MDHYPETEVIISLYQIRHTPIAEIAADYGLTTGAVYARLWRAGAITRGPEAMYRTDAEIVAAFQQLRSMDHTARTMGCSFYAVRDALGRAGIDSPGHGHERGEREAQVRTLIGLSRRCDLQWQHLAARLRIHPTTLWVYRKRLEPPA
jgi:hypothetical protein